MAHWVLLVGVCLRGEGREKDRVEGGSKGESKLREGVGCTKNQGGEDREFQKNVFVDSTEIIATCWV